MQSSCQLALKRNPSMDQTLLCDESFFADMTQQLNPNSFQRSFFGSTFNQISHSIPISTVVTPAVAIPKSHVYGVGFDDHLDVNLLAPTSDINLDDVNISLTYDAAADYQADFQSPLSPSLWGSSPEDFVKCDNLISVNKADLGEGPTLAELNANEESLLDNLNNFDLPELLSEEKESVAAFNDYEETKIRWEKDRFVVQDASSAPDNMPQTMAPSKATIPFSTSVPTTFTPQLWNKQERLINTKSDSKLKQTDSDTAENKPAGTGTTLHELLCQYRTTPKYEVPLLVNVNIPPLQASKGQLSSSAPTKPSLDQTWKISAKTLLQSSQFAIDELPKTVASTSTVPSGGLLDVSHDPETAKDDFDSHDEGFDSEPEDTDHYEELTSDAESTVSDDADGKRRQVTNSPPLKSSKKEKFFWQYNVQAKGPKINRLCLSPRSSDPHRLNEITDPVFSAVCSVQGIKHSGKARRGDGNDLNPNPRKLFQIGQELKKLNKVINDLTPVSELPFNARPRSRKEKNKLASRACRLKKKAQHEANKVKLFGLEHEHRKLVSVLRDTRTILVHRFQGDEAGQNNESLTPQIEKLVKANLSDETKVAGNAAEFVNKILDKISDGKASNYMEHF